MGNGFKSLAWSGETDFNSLRVTNDSSLTSRTLQTESLANARSLCSLLFNQDSTQLELKSVSPAQPEGKETRKTILKTIER